MIRILLTLIAAAVILPFAYILFKQVPLVKRMTIVSGGLVTAAIALGMQGAYSWYMVILVLLGGSFITAFIFMKLVEKEQNEKLRLAEERRELKQQKIKTSLTIQENIPATEELAEKPKPFGMQSIGTDREEITSG